MNDNITYREAVLSGTVSLKSSGIASPEYDSRQLMLKAASMSDTEYLMHGADKLPEAVRDVFGAYIQRRCNREPLQLMTGEAWFYGRCFHVNGDVLIPRYDTEVLVEHALKHVEDGAEVLDMCTGSGCIITTLALERRLGLACGCDISEAALKVAKDNADRLFDGLDGKEKVVFKQGDLYEALEGTDTFDMIVSNPPYIRRSVIPTLDVEVRKYDPVMALDGSEDGLVFYRRITAGAAKHLRNGGYLMYEIGHDQAADVSDIMREADFHDIEIIKDLAGLDRVVSGRLG